MADKGWLPLIQRIVVDTVGASVKPMSIQPAKYNGDGKFQLDQQLEIEKEVEIEYPERYGPGQKAEVAGHLSMETSGEVPGHVEAEITGEITVKYTLDEGETVLVSKRDGLNRYYLVDKLEVAE